MSRRRRVEDESNPLSLASRLLLRLLLNEQDYRTVVSDISELHERRRIRDGDAAARAWLRRQVRGYPIRMVGETVRRVLPRQRRHGTTDADGRRASVLDNLWRDLRHGVKSLARAPILSATILLTVGLGIGATTVIFSLINAVLIQPLPYVDAGNLVRIYTDAPPNRWPLSVADYRALEDQQTSFSVVAGYDNTTATYNSGDVVERVRGKFVTWDYFSLLGLRPLYGRTFNESDGRPESELTVVVSRGFWSRHLDGDPDAIGRSIMLDGRSYMVVGVLPRIVGPFEQQRDFFAAVEWQPPPRKGPFFIMALGRLKPGVDRSAAVDELRTINRRIFPIWQDSYQDQMVTWGMMDLKKVVVGDVGTTLLLALLAVGFLLLMASTNAASLLLARVTARNRELAVRAALGASRRRLLLHVLVESGLLALGGAFVGVLVMFGAMTLLTTTGSHFIPRTQELGIDGAVLWFLAGVTICSGLLFGLVPSLNGANFQLGRDLRTGGRSSTDSPGPRNVRHVMVVSQFAIAAPLLVGAGLLIGSLARLQEVSPGFDTHNVLTVRVTLPRERYQDAGDVSAFWDRAIARVREHPGVVAVGYANSRPPSEVATLNNFDLEDDPTPPGGTQPVVPWVGVTPGYFEALGVPLVQGRTFGETDTEEAPPVVLVDETWATRFFPNRDAVGRRMRRGGQTTGPLTTVVGVVGDVKYMGLDAIDRGTVYDPMSAGTYRSRFFVARTSADPMTVLQYINSVIHELDPSLPPEDAATIDEVIGDSLQAPRYLTVLGGAFAAVALLLSVVGIYGLMSHHVQRHTKDIGIRIALGGGPKRVVGEVVWHGLRLAVIGVLIGMAGAFYLTRFMSNLLYGVGPTDVLTFACVAAVMLGVALAACMPPARRAAAVDPVRSLREE
jgi:putative ABC transport system permease protein